MEITKTVRTSTDLIDTPVRKAFLPFSQPDIVQAEIDEVVDTLRSGWITTGRTDPPGCGPTGHLKSATRGR
jgi:hypothetical protein